MQCPSKKRKSGDLTSFKQEWEQQFFFVQSDVNSKCLICGRILVGHRKFGIERHYNTLHKDEYSLLSDAERMAKLNQLTMSCQTTANDSDVSHFCHECSICVFRFVSHLVTYHLIQHVSNDSPELRASYKIALNIARAGKPFTDGEFIKECINDAADLLCPLNVHQFQAISLSRRTVCRRISAMAGDVYRQLINKVQNFVAYSIALDESTDISDTAQLVIYVRGVDSDLHITEDFLDMISLKSTTTGADILKAVEEAVDSVGLDWGRLVSVTTDRAPAMKGEQTGFVGLLRKKLQRTEDSLYSIHCILHQEVLCAKVAKLGDVMHVVIRTVNYLRSHGLTHRQFQTYLAEIGDEYGDIPYHCEVRWLSRGNVLRRFFELRMKINQFLKDKKKHDPKLEDPEWVANLAFLVDITGHLNDLNRSLQGEKQLICEMIEKVQAFTRKLALWEEQLSLDNAAHFPTLSSVQEENYKEYVSVINTIKEEFRKRFGDVLQLSHAFELFSRPFAASVTDIPCNLQLELIDLQCNSRLRDKFLSARSVTEFYQNFPHQEFPRLHHEAARIMSMFGSTYVCERFFSVMKLNKSRLRANISDENLRNCLRLSVCRNFAPDINHIVNSTFVS